MAQRAVKWIASLQEPLDRGTATPSFRYNLFRPIAQRSDVLTALSPDCQIIEADLGKNAFTALVNLVWEFNQFPRLFSSHTLAWVDQGKTIPGEFDWATHRAHCQLCILPRDRFAPDLDTTLKIVNELHCATLDCLQERRQKPPSGSLIFLEPIIMKFGMKAQGSPTMGFGVHITVDGYAGNIEQCRIRCCRALSLFAELLRITRAT
jgi:hypothetical protein